MTSHVQRLPVRGPVLAWPPAARRLLQAPGLVLAGVLVGLLLPGWRAQSPSGAWSAEAAPVTFVSHAVGALRESLPVTARPGSGRELARLPAGTAVAVGSAVRVPAGLWTRDVYWVRWEGPGGAQYGFVAADGVALSAGVPPRLELGGVDPEALLAPSPGVAVNAAAGGAEEAGAVAAEAHAPATAGAGGAVAIPWLPATVAAWEAELVAAGQAVGVDPELLAIIMLVESGGNPQAVSPSGAVGLMQLMPATAQGIAAQLGHGDFTVEQLYEPTLNIAYGAHYVAEQLGRFGLAEDPDWQRSVELAAMAYNGGPGSVTSGNPPAEAVRYRAWVGGLWSERHAADSATLAAWWAAGGGRLVEAAQAVLGLPQPS